MNASRVSALLVMVAFSVLAGCSSLNPFSSSGPKPAKLENFQTTATLSTRWKAQIGKSNGYAFQPAVVNGAVYAAGYDGSVARFENGHTTWRAKSKEKLSAGVGSDGKLVVVVTTSGEAIAYDATNGKERWRAQVGAEVLAPPAVTESFVVIRASDSRLVGLDAKEGAFRWTYQRAAPPLSLRNSAGMLVEETIAVVGYPGGKLIAINIENGGSLWELAVATPRGVTELERIADIAGTAVLGRREVCAVAYQGRAGCFDLENGRAIWSRDFSSSVGMDRDTRFIMITDDANAVNALDAFSGATVWKQEALQLRSVSRPLIVGDLVAVGDYEGYVHLLDRETGIFAARSRTDGSAITADPKLLSSSELIVQTQSGGIFALEAR